MRTTWTGRLAAIAGLVGLAASARADEGKPVDDHPPRHEVIERGASPRAKPASSPRAAAAAKGGGEPAEAKRDAEPAVEKPPAPGDAAADRTEAVERLKALGPASAKDATSDAKALREAYEERLRWLDEWEKAAKQRQQAEHPDPSPEHEAAELKADLERVKASLDQSAGHPEKLIPVVFRNLSGQVSDAARSDMKEAIEAAKAELKEWEGRLDKLRAAHTGDPGKAAAALRAQRDKIYQRVVTLKGRGDERAAAIAGAKTGPARELAQERLTAFAWESRAEWERLKAHEARMALESKRADIGDLALQVGEAHLQLTRRCLGEMQSRYQALASQQERDLKRAAAVEERKAARSDDLLERYRARKTKRLLELKAYVLANESALATSSSPSLEEQEALADRAAGDFEGVKHLLDDGKVSHLDALRLNNDFRRIAAERDRIVRKDLAAADNLLARYEGLLTKVELALIDDTHDDRLEHENLLERLPRTRHAAAQTLFAELERQEVALLTRDRAALQKLADRAEQTHAQIFRRIHILDEHYGFIRTHIFWVRDEEPVGAATLVQVERDALLLARAAMRTAVDFCDRALWGRISAEFVLGLFAALGLPWPLRRARKWLAQAQCEASAPPGPAPAP